MIKRKTLLLLTGLIMTAMLVGCGAGGNAGGTQSNTTAQPQETKKEEAADTVPVGPMDMDALLNASWDEIEAQAKEEGGFTFSVWSDEAEWNQLMDVFNTTYGIKGSVLVGDKTTVMDKVLTELNGDASIDVMMLSGETVNGLMNANALTPGILPIMQHKDKLAPGLSVRKEGVSNELGYWVPVSTSPCGFLYNANEIKEEDLPQTFADFEKFIEENPKRFGMCIPESGGTGQGVMEMFIAALTGGLDQYLIAENNECDPALLEKWDVVWEWFDAHKDMITFTTSNNDGISRLNSGEIWLVAAWNSNVKDNAEQGNLSIPHGYYVPEQGICYSGEVFSVVSNSTKPAASLLFINWITSVEGQQALAEYVHSIPSRMDVEVDLLLLTPEERQKNTDWMSACYKTQYIQDFSKNVLQ